MITLFDAKKEILYQGPGLWEKVDYLLKIQIESKEFSFLLMKTPEVLSLETKETLEMKLQLFSRQPADNQAQVQTPYGLLELPAGLVECKEEENSVFLSYWIGQNDPENIQSFTIERGNDD